MGTVGLSGELGPRASRFLAVPQPGASAAWLGEAGVGQRPALRASHRLVPACVSAALGAGRGGHPSGSTRQVVGRTGGNSCLHFTGPQRTGTQMTRHPSLPLLVCEVG